MSESNTRRGAYVHHGNVETLRAAVVGCGLIGGRRAEIVRKSATEELVMVADVDGSRARKVAEEMGCLATTDWNELTARNDIDVVIVSTTNDWLAPITVGALQRGKSVLVEKPMARTLAEAEEICRIVSDGHRISAFPGAKHGGNAGRNPIVGVGFNHRHHGAVWKAHEMVADGAIGDVLFIRCRYGHGGRPGYEAEWRLAPSVSGGGELMDQGIHAMDLFRWFLGDLVEACGFTETYTWRPKGGIKRASKAELELREQRISPRDLADDNGFALFRTERGQVASLHASWTQWKNLFSFEVFGEKGYLIVEGLGGSYGAEQLIWGRRRAESGPPDEERFQFPAQDNSWEAEWTEFTKAVRESRAPLASGYDGWQALRLVRAVYESARDGRVVKL